MINIRFHGPKDAYLGSVRWPAVPRIGDSVAIGKTGEVQIRKVVDVLWGTTPPSRNGESCEVDVTLGKEVI